MQTPMKTHFIDFTFPKAHISNHIYCIYTHIPNNQSKIEFTSNKHRQTHQLHCATQSLSLCRHLVLCIHKFVPKCIYTHAPNDKTFTITNLHICLKCKLHTFVFHSTKKSHFSIKMKSKQACPFRSLESVECWTINKPKPKLKAIQLFNEQIWFPSIHWFFFCYGNIKHTWFDDRAWCST